MNRIAISLAATSLLTLAGCGSSLSDARSSAHAPHAITPKQAAAKTAEAADDETAAPDLPTGRQPGDFVVYRFSGSFRKAPITLTERVIAREGSFLVVDLTFEEGRSKQQLRVRMNDATGARGEVFAVARIEGGAEKPATLGLYEALMARTALVADQNEEQIAAEPVSMAIGTTSVTCTKTSYRVKIGKREATLATCGSPEFAWGDVGAEIKAQDGTLLYRAEVVDVGNTPNAGGDSTVATSDYE